MIVKDRTLYVKVLEAKNVFPDKGRHSDSFCSVSVEGGEERRTPTVHRDANPFFGEELVFNDQLPTDMGGISIGLWQDQKHAGSGGASGGGAAVGGEKLLGRTMFPRDLLEDGRFEEEQWYGLMHNESSQAAWGEAKLGMKLRAEQDAHHRIRYTLTVSVDEVRKFSPGPTGSRDVYVVLHILPDPEAISTQKTQVVRKSLNPVFNRDITFHLTPAYRTQELHVSVWDTRPSEPCLGHLLVPLDTLERNDKIDSRWRGLMPPPGLSESSLVEARAKSYIKTMQQTVKEYDRKKSPHKLVDTKFLSTISFCGHCGLGLSPGRTHLQCSQCKISCHLNCSKVIANNCGTIGAVRVKIKYSASTILPLENYRPFLDLLSQDGYRLCHLFGKVSKDREDAAWPLIKLMEADNVTQVFLLAIIQAEIADTNDPNTLFRANSMASKAVDVYMRYLGKAYLKSTIGDIIKMIVSKKIHCELDPMKLDKGEDIEKNRRVFFDLNQRIMNAIYDTRFALPSPWRPLFAHVQQQVTRQFPYDPTVRYTSVSGFIFLRFFAPAILGPKLFDLVDEYIEPKTSRTLTLLAKTLQTLANLVPFGDKEPYMKEMNPFIEANIDKMKNYIDGIAAKEFVAHTAVSLHYVRYETAREAARLFNLYVRAAPAILQSMTEGDAPIVRRLAKVLTKLTIKTTAVDGIDFNPFSFPTLKQSYANLLNMRIEVKPPKTEASEDVSPGPSRPGSVVPGTLTELLQNAVDSPEFTSVRTPAPVGLMKYGGDVASPLEFSSGFGPLFNDVAAELLGLDSAGVVSPFGVSLPVRSSVHMGSAVQMGSSLPTQGGLAANYADSSRIVPHLSNGDRGVAIKFEGDAPASPGIPDAATSSTIALADGTAEVGNQVAPLTSTLSLSSIYRPFFATPTSSTGTIASSSATDAVKASPSASSVAAMAAQPSDITSRSGDTARQAEPGRQQPPPPQQQQTQQLQPPPPASPNAGRVPAILTPIATSMMGWTTENYTAALASAPPSASTTAPFPSSTPTPTSITSTDSLPPSTLYSPTSSLASRRTARSARPTLNTEAKAQTRLDALAIMALLNSARESAVDQAESSLTAHGECVACKKKVIGPDFKKVGEMVWHADHFACATCGVVVEVIKEAEVHKGNVYCAKHKMRICAACQTAIQDPNQALTDLAQNCYHADCFVCRACQCPLNEGYMVFQDTPLCPEDYYRAAGLMCGGCGGRIAGYYIQISGRKYHVDCKRCDKCLETLANKSYFILDSNVFCSSHVHEMLTCFACGTLVTGTGPGQQIMRLSSGRTYHPHCFRCSDCKVDVSKAGFYECAGLPKCQNCYIKTFG
ncbi:hypothetical protein PhCBS80983_g00191 [Powellomyces hirtus]|uniref:Uncharacterized protein n=1 Tax=Powellomyces hirtus TaxID=109895 RepID=A0A507EIC1_9FUNG|nr:hypothetical protein PhCBS80983_g00191 [Powellomyces hirtus]